MAATFTPYGDIHLRNYYQIINATNISSGYFFGLYDWRILDDVSQNYISFNYSHLTFNESYLNNTINIIVGTANESLKEYVDTQDTTFNDSMKDYVDTNFPTKTNLDDNITSANDSMKLYVDARDIHYNGTMTNYTNATYVPYIGAHSNVDIAPYNLTVNKTDTYDLIIRNPVTQSPTKFYWQQFNGTNSVSETPTDQDWRFASLNVTNDVIIDGNLYMQNNNITNISTLQLGTSEADHYIYFYEDGSPTGEFIKWYNDGDRFDISDTVDIDGSLEVDTLTSLDYILALGDISTFGAGDDLWLGHEEQASALFRAYADGSLYALGNVYLNNTLNVVDGEVGIGKSPNYKLDVAGNINMTNASITDCINFASGGKICSGT